MNIDIRQATEEDSQAALSLLEDARHYKNSIGDTAWGDEPFTEEEVKNLLVNGISYIAFSNGRPACFVNTTTEDKALWGDKGTEKDSLYIHRFVSSISFRGQGIGKEMLSFLGNKAAEQGRHFLRLDCEVTNPDLQQYYLRQGFKMKGTKDMKRYVACLLEKQIHLDT